MARTRSTGRQVNYCLTIGHSVLMLFELTVLVCLSVFAYYLRFTDYFPLYKQQFACDDNSISYPYFKSENATRSALPFLQDYSENVFLYVVTFSPIVLVSKLFHFLNCLFTCLLVYCRQKRIFSFSFSFF